MPASKVAETSFTSLYGLLWGCIKVVLLTFKRFWIATPNSADENAEADKLIEAVDELAKLMEE